MAIKQSSTNLKDLKSYRACSLTIMESKQKSSNRQQEISPYLEMKRHNTLLNSPCIKEDVSEEIKRHRIK